MRRTAVGGRARTAVTTAMAVVGIVLASLVGLDTWADAAATHGVRASVDGSDFPSS
jgi:hypothetical protein